MDQQAEKDKAERVTELGRRTREEIAKWDQMTALRFQTGMVGGGGDTSSREVTHGHRPLKKQNKKLTDPGEQPGILP